MPYCPECRSEYREGFTTCKECGVDLVASLPPERRPEDEHLVELASFQTTAEAGMLQELLEKNGIASVFHGASDPITAPAAAGSIELLVDEADLPRAEEICRAFFEAQAGSEGDSGEDSEERG